MRKYLLTILFTCFALLTACGQTGPLYLPPPDQANQHHLIHHHPKVPSQ